MICPLCLSPDHRLFDQDKLRSYHQCLTCELVFVPRDELVTESEEKKRYDAHENDESDQGYVNYLRSIADSIRSHLNDGMEGLDFGCGRSKLLAELLKPAKVASFDVYFHPDFDLLDRRYDFVVASEVVEHLRGPREDVLKLFALADHLFIKTKLYPETGFSQWFYKRDITHVQFFSERTFREVLRLTGHKSFEKIGNDLFYFKK